MVSVIVPLKLNSRRLPNKNFLMLGDKPLASYIFSTLLSTDKIDNVYCYTSQPKILDVLPKGVRLLARPKGLDGDDVQANELFRYAVERIPDEIQLICQAPGPFVRTESLLDGINAIESGRWDSAVAVKKIQTYCWYDGQPLNYNPERIEQTQKLIPVYQETSGIYIFKRDDYLESNSRINGRVYMINVSDREAIDIDDPKDYAIASRLLDYNDQTNEYDKDPYLSKIVSISNFNGGIKHVSFDLDGVLIDSMSAMKKAWDYVKDKHNLEATFEQYAEHIGREFSDILQRIGVEESLVHSVRSDYEEASASYAAEIKPMFNALAGLKSLSRNGVKLSVVTSKSSDRTSAILANLFSDVSFDAVITPDQVSQGRGKPSPDPLLLACIKVGVEPSASVYIGDMEVDRLAAKSAGVNFIHANWGYGTITTLSDVWFDNFDDAIKFLVDTHA